MAESRPAVTSRPGIVHLGLESAPRSIMVISRIGRCRAYRVSSSPCSAAWSRTCPCRIVRGSSDSGLDVVTSIPPSRPAPRSPCPGSRRGRWRDHQSRRPPCPPPYSLDLPCRSCLSARSQRNARARRDRRQVAALGPQCDSTHQSAHPSKRGRYGAVTRGIRIERVSPGGRGRGFQPPRRARPPLFCREHRASGRPV